MSPVPFSGEPGADRAQPSWSIGSWLPSRRHDRSGRRFTAGPATGAAALVTLAVLAVAVLTSGNSPGAGAGSLPWPPEGQTSVVVEGLGAHGDLGTRGERTPVPIASVTKVMTAWVILRDRPLRAGEDGPLVTVDRTAANESVSGVESSVPVREGTRLSERRLLELLLIPSGNNIARLLARWNAGSQEAFVMKMNRAARDLGMRHTTYTGASGIEPTTTSTSADQLRLARRVMRDEVFRTVVAMPGATVPGVPGTIRNTNTLLGTAGVIGLKTGSSTPAGGALMWAATASDSGGRDRLILGVVLHQRSGTDPRQGLRAALARSHALIEGIRRWLSTTSPGTR
ncbi:MULTISPECIES: D-alanyl-D-alanine carboxypeptidase family protein [Streptomyces]|uniref:D-alanyl-D-alanine carboxypeptidase family protein n=1 Tax=Streptomyces TaxID=1883 RepID=UPI001787531A|nr:MULTISPECIES: D-alanyl-D-alanine carboxypeptidase [unclassified Streptomyces]MDX3092294.1 D-alanyl-D-alanine carboxypeptidase [Streptomyces sp. ME12-02E]MDX3335690.1 D-alanyl-D-alanine carboxypeptidase [Streptomyces sp. ME02-6978a]GHE50863.1 D-alanyl-D-alanine carboxypeptidase [Streptomyces griseoaurantiacus]